MLPTSDTYTCATCGTTGELRDGREMALYLPLAVKGSPMRFCTITCLIEGACDLRQAHPQLSKSVRV
jgi:hypothetical protein